ncbi:2-hydroxychromene-2-carboxylate isomerase [Neolecta irregularis DAH-3]|uniref:2-hydroxychromene-2-carboxylate isomerase n=1 Tax=Neolecta irregularis (strain DAH-3) TaxID=1198029 RepID=A0A1U7LN87_NEOID|nr:2-hydroxychromene-2-carboxylate isomerase [Neolecta irregularis DAH-3]|eukprot:OLL24114.1 2-hydroxychromene-2-carboxylate isomerase [Neolecta irregularis DAH-3]
MSSIRNTIEFGYDISCPYAYMASRSIEALANRSGAEIIWKPVLLGALYEATGALQGKEGSASDVFSPTKKGIYMRDFEMSLKRHKVPYRYPDSHPVKTVHALRLIYATPNSHRAALTHALYKAYWSDNFDISSHSALLEISRSSTGLQYDESTFSHLEYHTALKDATNEAIKRGAFGVPIFWVEHENRFWWGFDRMVMVEAVCTARSRNVAYHLVTGLSGLHPRCLRVPPVPKQRRRVKLEFWFDFSSPFAYLGWTQLERMKREAGTGLIVEYKPILLGALFKMLGGPQLPMDTMSQAKKRYYFQDMYDWAKHWSAIGSQQTPPDPLIKFEFPDVFPIKTINSLRIAIADNNTIPTICKCHTLVIMVDSIDRAAWGENQNISDPGILTEVLSKKGFNADELLEIANSTRTKEQLRKNTEEAHQLGLCGVPSYRVSDRTKDGWKVNGGITWGQDRIPVVQDLIAGWHPDRTRLIADVSTSHRLGMIRGGNRGKERKNDYRL